MEKQNKNKLTQVQKSIIIIGGIFLIIFFSIFMVITSLNNSINDNTKKIIKMNNELHTYKTQLAENQKVEQNRVENIFKDYHLYGIIGASPVSYEFIVFSIEETDDCIIIKTGLGNTVEISIKNNKAFLYDKGMTLRSVINNPSLVEDESINSTNLSIDGQAALSLYNKYIDYMNKNGLSFN